MTKKTKKERVYVRELDWCRDRIVTQIIKPTLLAVIQERKPRNLDELREGFEAATGHHPSITHIRRWMDESGIQMKKTVSYRVEGREEPTEVLPAEDDLPERIKTLGTPPPPGGRPGMVSPQLKSSFYNGNGGVLG